MAYKIKLMINGKENEFVRNGEPNLRDTTNALKVQMGQLKMYDNDHIPTNKEIDENEANLANFAVDFWKSQFSKEEVIDGAVVSLKSVESIMDALGDALGTSDGKDNKGKN